MSLSPDTDALYQSAINSAHLAERLEITRKELQRHLREEELRLILTGEFSTLKGKERIRVCNLRASQIVEEKYKDLYDEHWNIHAELAAIHTRNEGVVAAGWAENFALNKWQRELSEGHKPQELDK